MNPIDCGVGQPRSHELSHMGFLQFIFNLLNGGINDGNESSQSSQSSQPSHSQAPNPCESGCGRMTQWSGHSMCKTCFHAINFTPRPVSASRMSAYNSIIHRLDASGLSEAEFRGKIGESYLKDMGSETIEALVTSATLRKVMGWD